MNLNAELIKSGPKMCIKLNTQNISPHKLATDVTGSTHIFKKQCSTCAEGAHWLSGRVLDSRLRGRGFELHWRYCVAFLSRIQLSLLSTGSTQKDPPHITEKNVDWDIKNQIKWRPPFII